MSARLYVHPRWPQREPMSEIVRFFELRGYALSNHARGYEARPVRRRSVVEAMFAFGRRPQ